MTVPVKPELVTDIIDPAFDPASVVTEVGFEERPKSPMENCCEACVRDGFSITNPSQ